MQGWLGIICGDTPLVGSFQSWDEVVLRGMSPKRSDKDLFTREQARGRPPQVVCTGDTCSPLESGARQSMEIVPT
jgi:hypothetical protein